MHKMTGEGLAASVHLVHILTMKQLSAWMKTQGINDEALAEKAKGKISRSQISRIRRGKNGASPKTAKTLEKLTGIPWHEFVGAA